MERLTGRKEDGHAYIVGCPDFEIPKIIGLIIQRVVDRLAAYEETGLEPEDFKRAFSEDTILKLAGQALGITPDRLRELAQADREGKIPKYTIGDTIYDRFGDAWEVKTAERHLLGEKPDWLYRCGHVGTDDYCALWSFEILTRDVAEAALRREQEKEKEDEHE